MIKNSLAFLISILFFLVSTAYSAESCNQTTTSSCIDWKDGVIYAVGMGVPNPKFKSRAQQNFSAQKAAETVAKRNLLQMVEELHVTSSTTVKDGMLESDEIKTVISGTLRQVRTIGQPRAMADGSVWVTVAMHMKNLLPSLLGEQAYGNFIPPAVKAPVAIKEAEKTQMKKQPVAREKQIYTGLIVDARGLNVVPALSPKIMDKAGKELYGSAYVDREFAVKMGMAGYGKTPEEIINNDRIARNPLKIKAISKSKEGASDLIINAEDADLLRNVYKTQTFLREARVMILVD